MCVCVWLQHIYVSALDECILLCIAGNLDSAQSAAQTERTVYTEKLFNVYVSSSSGWMMTIERWGILSIVKLINYAYYHIVCLMLYNGQTIASHKKEIKKNTYCRLQTKVIQIKLLFLFIYPNRKCGINKDFLTGSKFLVHINEIRSHRN